MSTEIRYVGDLPVESPILDEEAQAARRELDALVMAEYAETGVLNSLRVCEAAAAFEDYAKAHMVKENE